MALTSTERLNLSWIGMTFCFFFRTYPRAMKWFSNWDSIVCNDGKKKEFHLIASKDLVWKLIHTSGYTDDSYRVDFESVHLFVNFPIEMKILITI